MTMIVNFFKYFGFDVGRSLFLSSGFHEESNLEMMDEVNENIFHLTDYASVPVSLDLFEIIPKHHLFISSILFYFYFYFSFLYHYFII